MYLKEIHIFIEEYGGKKKKTEKYYSLPITNEYMF